MLAFLVSSIRLGMAFLFGSTGETITEKSGHLNLGIPGVMCVGASCGCFAEYLYLAAAGPNANYFLAVFIPILATMLGGAVMGFLFSFLFRLELFFLLFLVFTVNIGVISESGDRA